MEGGIGILLLVIIAVVAIGFGIALYVTGGALWGSKTGRRGELGGDERRPEHERPTSPAQEHTEFVGAPGRDDK
jgi:hypothetical protein